MSKELVSVSAHVQPQVACENNKQTYICSNADIYADIVSLAYILYMRLEVPEHYRDTPAFTNTHQLIDEIVTNKRDALTQLVHSRSTHAKDLLAELRALYYQVMDELEFEEGEKYIAWLLLRANSIRQCALKTSKSVSSVRYTLSRMCEKLNCDSKEEFLRILKRRLVEN